MLLAAATATAARRHPKRGRESMIGLRWTAPCAGSVAARGVRVAIGARGVARQRCRLARRVRQRTAARVVRRARGRTAAADPVLRERRHARHGRPRDRQQRQHAAPARQRDRRRHGVRRIESSGGRTVHAELQRACLARASSRAALHDRPPRSSKGAEPIRRLAGRPRSSTPSPWAFASSTRGTGRGKCSWS